MSRRVKRPQWRSYFCDYNHRFRVPFEGAGVSNGFSPHVATLSPLPLILLAVFATGMGQTIVFAVLAPLGREVGLAEIHVGLIIAASSVVFSIASPRWGRKSERIGRRRTMIIGLLGYSVGTALFATAFLAGMQGWLTGGAVLLALVVTRMIQSTVMAATTPAANAYVADITTREQRVGGMGRLGAAHNLGTILGPAIGGALAVFSLLMPLYFAAVITMATALVVWRRLPEAPRVSVPPPDAHSVSASAGPGYLDPRVFPYLLIGICLYIAFSVVQQTLGFYIQDRLVLDSRETARHAGMVMMVGAVASLAAQIVAVRRQWSPRRLIITGLPMVLTGALLMAAADGMILMALAMAFVGGGAGLSGPGYSAAASRAVGPHEQGAVAGLVAAAPALGYVMGPLAGTALYQIDPCWPYLFVAVSFAPLMVYAVRKLGRQSP